MQTLLRTIRRLTAAACALSVCLLTSCIYEGEDEPAIPADEDASFVNIALAVPMAANAPDVTDKYQEGDTNENYIDISGRNYRIYFFGEDKVLLDQFNPMGFNTVTGTDYREYKIYGMTPKSVRNLSKFKVMVLANWPVYPAVTPGTTTIDDICNSDLAKFDCLTNHELSIAEKRLIPMYGIREYSGVTFTGGETTDLVDPVTMLRAMAKVEIILDVEQELELREVALVSHNARGYCAPQRVYSQADYGQGLNWNTDYLHRLHLISDKNDDDATTRRLTFRCANRRTSEKKETWVAYIPEYRNVNSDGTAASDEAHIELNLDIQEEGDAPYRIFFAEYTDNATTSEADSKNLKRMDIERNNIYRFYVSPAEGGLFIRVKRWENTYDNKFIFE